MQPDKATRRCSRSVRYIWTVDALRGSNRMSLHSARRGSSHAASASIDGMKSRLLRPSCPRRSSPGSVQRLILLEPLKPEQAHPPIPIRSWFKSVIGPVCRLHDPPAHGHLSRGFVVESRNISEYAIDSTPCHGRKAPHSRESWAPSDRTRRAEATLDRPVPHGGTPWPDA